MSCCSSARLALKALFSATLVACAQATTIVPVPVQTAVHTVAGSFGVTVDDGAGGSLTNVDVNVHKVRYPADTDHNPVTPPVSTLLTNVYYAHFSFGNGSARVKVKLNNFSATYTNYTYTLSPTSYALPVTQNGNELTFTLTQSRYLMLAINDLATSNKQYYDAFADRPLYLILMADDLETGAPPPSGSGIYNVTATPYNAVGNYVNDETAHIQQAIDDANAAGGGTVYVPAGAFKTTAPLRLKSNVQFYLAAGAVLRADTTWVPTGTTYLITANSASSSSVISNAKVFGRGTLDCNGVDVGGEQTEKSLASPLIAAMQIKDSHDITVDGVVVRESLGWTFYINRCDSITQKNVKVINWNGDYNNYRENDGMNLIQCQNSSITHCLIWTCDDGACLKGAYSSTDGAYGNSTPLELVSNCNYNDLVIWTAGGAVKFGNQAYTDITNSYFRNIDIVHAKWAIRIEPWRGSGQGWDNIGFIDVRCENVGRTLNDALSQKSYPIDFTSKQLYGSPSDQGFNNVNQVAVTNFTCANFAEAVPGTSLHGGTLTGYQSGADIARIDNVTLVNLVLAGATRTSATSAELSINSLATWSFPTDTNRVLSLTSTSRSANWYTTGSFSYAAVNDGSTASEGQVSDSADAWIVYNLGSTRTLDSAKIDQDNGTFSAESWKLEWWDSATSTWKLVFDFTPCPVAGYNTVWFAPATTTQVRITFHPAAGKKIGINEVEIYGH